MLTWLTQTERDRYPYRNIAYLDFSLGKDILSSSVTFGLVDLSGKLVMNHKLTSKEFGRTATSSFTPNWNKYLECAANRPQRMDFVSALFTVADPGNWIGGWIWQIVFRVFLGYRFLLVVFRRARLLCRQKAQTPVEGGANKEKNE